MEELKTMKENLINCVEQQINGNLEQVNAKELGEAVDMIKDLSEAIYYCTVTEAMKDKYPQEQYRQPKETYYYTERVVPRMEYDPYMHDMRDLEKERMMPPYVMYYGNNGGYSNSNGGNSGNGGRRSYSDGYPMTYPQIADRDMREGRSSIRRKMYMEGQQNHQDKNRQMQELESYVQELSFDITEMIREASPEEKQMLQQKISTLATKIK